MPIGRPRDASADSASTGTCAPSFGDELTNAFGRIDGVVTAVVPLDDRLCAGAVVQYVDVEVKAHGKIYQLLVDVESDRGADRRVRYEELAHALPSPAWSEGWHAAMDLDEAVTLGPHDTDVGFAPYASADLAKKLASVIAIGTKVSI